MGKTVDEQTSAAQRTIADLQHQIAAYRSEREELLRQQTATADLLKVISRSTLDLEHVLEGIARAASDLCAADDVSILIRQGDILRVAAHHGPIPMQLGMGRPVNRDWVSGRAVVDERPVHVRDLATAEDYPLGRQVAGQFGHRTTLAVPLLRDDGAAGCILLRRLMVEDFTDTQIALLQSFADQAVIAIENTRLFDEVQTRTRELTEALERQTATSEVLRIISNSPGELKPVFDAMLRNAVRICEAEFGVLFRHHDGTFEGAAWANVNPAYEAVLRERGAFRPTAGAPLHRLLQTKGLVHDTDVSRNQSSPAAVYGAARSLIALPMSKDDELVGAFVIYRTEVRPFTDKQIELVTSFADQAVIAIENARLIHEIRQALERQSATADILKVIASSRSDVQPVFDSIAESARRVVSGFSAVVTRVVGKELHLVAFTAGTEAGKKALAQLYPQTLSSSMAAAQAVRTGRVVMHVDTEKDASEITKALARARGFRSLLLVPLLLEGTAIGTINVTRVEPGGFDDNAISLMQTFADQAVIAIENARLFDEVQARTRDLQESLQQQTATADVLKVISRSAFDLDTVMNTLARSASELCGAKLSGLFLREGDVLVMKGTSEIGPELEKSLREARIPIDDTSYMGRAVLHGEIGNVPDFDQARSSVRFFQERLGFKSILMVPLMREGRGIGVFALARDRVGEYSPRQVDLVQTFADQAVIALENVRLFDEVQARTKELATSLDELRTAQDRLVQTEKLASLGQLTAGIAHEIKNPLNFVNNFSALSAELTGELNDLLKNAALTDKMREEVDELTQLLRDNLDKVVQHGKRADSIVKNMLLHSREGSREHRPADINSLLDESLNLAYHGARAEKGKFNITLQRHFDTDAGAVEVFPQEITRAFLNLISNGVYAATKRKIEDKEPGFEPTLWATTKNLGSAVEIHIRDNGNGISPEVKEKIFNPFFTTKPAGEGTGLGLSMTHDIIVKQHGGRIDVATEPGKFTEFTIVLPRKSAVAGKDGGET